MRKIELTMSAAPASTRNSTAAHRDEVRPNPATASPHTAIAATTATPCRWIRRTHPEVPPISMAPSGIAANSQPRAKPPPGGSPKVRSAISGKRALGIPATIATMSTTNEASSTFCAAMYRKPSTTSRSPARRAGPEVGGRDGSRHTAQSTAASAKVSTRYRLDRPTTGSSAPAAIGPNTAPNVVTVPLRAAAEGSRSSGTTRATTALRVGMLTAKNAWLTLSRPSTTHTDPTSSSACAHSRHAVAAMPVLVTSRRVRRSTVSATAPPQRPNTSSGTRPNSPARPT